MTKYDTYFESAQGSYMGLYGMYIPRKITDPIHELFQNASRHLLPLGARGCHCHNEKVGVTPQNIKRCRNSLKVVKRRIMRVSDFA